MAVKAKKRKPVRNSRQAEERHIGREVTDWDRIADYETAVRDSLRHYGYFYEHKDAMQWTKQFVKANRKKADMDRLSQLSPVQIPMTLGSLCKMSLMGCTLSSTHKDFLETKLDETLKRAKPVSKKKKIEAPKKTPADIVKEKTSDFIAEVEYVIDDYNPKNHDLHMDYSVYNELVKIDAPYNLAKGVHDYYEPLARELEAVSGRNKDKELVEGYEHIRPTDRKKKLSFIQQILDDCSKYMGTKIAAKKPRKPRKTKAKPASKLVEKVKYLSRDDTLKVASVNPEKIVGAKVVILFNRRYNTLTYLEGESLSVKGTTIYGFDDEKSFKKTLRKAEENLGGFTSGTKARIRKSMEALKTKPQTAKGRMNEDTIILKVF